MIKNFEQYNESLRDKMTPKSDEDVRKALKNGLSANFHEDDRIPLYLRYHLNYLAKKAKEDGYFETRLEAYSFFENYIEELIEFANLHNNRRENVYIEFLDLLQDL